MIVHKLNNQTNFLIKIVTSNKILFYTTIMSKNKNIIKNHKTLNIKTTHLFKIKQFLSKIKTNINPNKPQIILKNHSKLHSNLPFNKMSERTSNL